ncbi:MAG: hypothetical protein MK085_08955 [Phycisphaerales bacterium]|nr:hypothetical protein [Phycisphaerales bacterium]
MDQASKPAPQAQVAKFRSSVEQAYQEFVTTIKSALEAGKIDRPAALEQIVAFREKACMAVRKHLGEGHELDPPLASAEAMLDGHAADEETAEVAAESTTPATSKEETTMSASTNYHYKVARLGEVEAYTSAGTGHAPSITAQVEAVLNNPEFAGYEYCDSITVPITVYVRPSTVASMKQLDKRGHTQELCLVFRRPA